MQIPGRVAAWEPPHRVVFDGGGEKPELAFEWLVEAKDGGTCIVRLVNTGFGSGGHWDDQYDAMHEGWQLFLLNLRLHLEHFPGQSATSMLPMAMWDGTREAVWTKLTRALGISSSPAIGSRVQLGGADSPTLVGTIADAASWRLALIVEHPAPGTAFLAAEGTGDQTGVSVWSYLYGDEGRIAIERDEPLWSAWLQANAS